MMRRAGNMRMALQSIRSARWRSFLTMLGVIIGVMSVVLVVSLGEGVKQQLRAQSQQRGDDLITITSGQRVVRDSDGQIVEVKTLVTPGTSLGDLDYRTIAGHDSVDKIAPLARINGISKYKDNSYEATIYATTSDLPQLLGQDLAYGGFFADKAAETDSAVIGPRVAENLFGENVPTGKSFTVRDKTFIVRGIFDEFNTQGSLPLSNDYNNVIFIPYTAGREMVSSNIVVDQILVKPKPEFAVGASATGLRQQLRELHAGQEDFTVLTQAEMLRVADSMLNLVTTFISAVASISLVVGGIGIMNIMFVLVTERTREIGVRKAVGATTRQILTQFLTEAVVVSLIGGLIGVLASILANFLMRVFSDLQPVITWPVIAGAMLMALAVGVVFGVVPALKAASQDPIESLRYE